MKFKLKILSTLLLLVFIVGYNCSGIEAQVSVVTISSLQRILQGEVDVNGEKEAEVFCAKGETESFQIVVLNPTDESLPAIDIKADNWRFTGTPGSGVPEITLFREHYIQIKKLSPRSRGKPGWYPDALIPFINPYTGKRITHAKYLAANQDVAAHKSQGYWVDVRVGSDVKAGTYKNEMSVLSAGSVIKRIPLTVNVWDFELPKVHKLKTYFGRLRDVSYCYGVSKNSPEYKSIEQRYLLLLQEHGVSSVCPIEPQVFNRDTGEVTFTAGYLSELKAFTQKFHPQMYKVPSFYLNDTIRLKGYLQSYYKFIQENPWVGQAFLYIDEPGDLKTYKMVKMSGQYVHQFAPSIKLLVTEQVKPEKPDYPSLEGSVDIWVPCWHLADTSDIRRRQAVGDEVWSYTALAQADGVPVWLMDFPLLNYRAPLWSSYSLGLKGILYWQTTAWASMKKDHRTDPWTDAGAYSKGNRVWNGEGSLLYPGGDAGVDGPVASMRLKVLRDGIEDFDYFLVCSGIEGEQYVRAITETVAKDFKNYSRIAADYVEKRRYIAGNILKRIN